MKTITSFSILFFFFFLSFVGNSQVSTAIKLDANMALKKADADGIVWYNPKEAPFRLVGFEWIKQENVYRRLPVHPEWELSQGVEGLANHTAGGQVRFKTNSKRILINVELREKSGMYHMPATGQSGFDLYMELDGENRYIKTTRFSVDSTHYKVELYNSEENSMHLFTINFPLYNGVNFLEIGIDEGAAIEPPTPFKTQGKFVIYGTSITQGGCVCRPGMAYSNIMSRTLNVEFINLGFSGNGKGEPALANLINQISDVRFIILDYEANTSKTIKNSLENFVDILREKHPETPILIMSKVRYARERKGTKKYALLISNRDFQRDLVQKKKEAGDNNIYFLDGSKVLGSKYYECAVDGVHPSDLGSQIIADAMTKAIREILN
jgi:lysophospholipase L1-like esterase